MHALLMWHTRQGTSLRLAVLETAALSKLRMHVVGFNVSPNDTWVIDRPTSFALNGIGASNGVRTRSRCLEGNRAANYAMDAKMQLLDLSCIECV